MSFNKSSKEKEKQEKVGLVEIEPEAVGNEAIVAEN